MNRSISIIHSAAAMLLAVSVLGVAPMASAKDGDESKLPVCTKKIGTLAVHEPENKWWTSYGLESPEAVIKAYLNECKCFTLLDRGKGLDAAKAERALAGSGETRVGSNVGKGQMKAADYVLVPDIVNKNANSGGKRLGAAIGGLVGGRAGALVGGVNLKSKTADVVLTLTDIRSTEQVAIVQGHAKKTNLGWGAGAGSYFGGFAALGASSYSNTEIGQVVAMAYLDAVKKLIEEVQTNTPDAKGDNVAQAVTMAKPGRMYSKADPKSAVVRDLDPGMMLYPTGEKEGVWWKVSDELGNEGWVSSALFGLSK